MSEFDHLVEAIVRRVVEAEVPALRAADFTVRVESDLRLFSVREVSELLSTSTDYVYARIASGELSVVELGHGRAKQRVRSTELRRFIESRG